MVTFIRTEKATTNIQSNQSMQQSEKHLFVTRKQQSFNNTNVGTIIAPT